MKKENDSSSNVRKYDVSQVFYQKVLDLSVAVQNSLIRLSSDAISSLIDTAKCFPEPYIQKVFNAVKTSVSGDVYLSRMVCDNNNNLVLLVVREGSDKKSHLNVMKTDTFVVKVDDSNNVEGDMYACYHLDCPGRYTEPGIYETLRNSLLIGQPHDCNDSQISSLMNPIMEGVKETDKILQAK